MRISTNVSATNSRKISADTAAKMSVSSLVSGCRNVSLNVALRQKMTANRKKMQIESATIAGVRLGFFGGRSGFGEGKVIGLHSPWHSRFERGKPRRLSSSAGSHYNGCLPLFLRA